MTGRAYWNCGGLSPRVRGNDVWAVQWPLIHAGLSPRVRGNPALQKVLNGNDRSIPARAGEPSIPGNGPSPTSVYPRACGGTFNNGLGEVMGDGLSPRVRGNR